MPISLEQAQASNLANNELKLKDFKGSNGWIERFKHRQDLISRRETTTRVLPVEAFEKVKQFSDEVREIIDGKKVKAQNILNMNQVPRYYQAE